MCPSPSAASPVGRDLIAEDLVGGLEGPRCAVQAAGVDVGGGDQQLDVALFLSLRGRGTSRGGGGIDLGGGDQQLDVPLFLSLRGRSRGRGRRQFKK